MPTQHSTAANSATLPPLPVPEVRFTKQAMLSLKVEEIAALLYETVVIYEGGVNLPRYEDLNAGQKDVYRHRAIEAVISQFGLINSRAESRAMNWALSKNDIHEEFPGEGSLGTIRNAILDFHTEYGGQLLRAWREEERYGGLR